MLHLEPIHVHPYFIFSRCQIKEKLVTAFSVVGVCLDQLNADAAVLQSIDQLWFLGQI